MHEILSSSATPRRCSGGCCPQSRNFREPAAGFVASSASPAIVRRSAVAVRPSRRRAGRSAGRKLPGAPRPGTGFACCPRTRGSRRGAATGPGNDKTRERRLHRLVRLSRLLSGIACRSFAGVEPVAAAQDFENRYGYRPWLVETFPMHRSARRTGFMWVQPGDAGGRKDWLPIP